MILARKEIPRLVFALLLPQLVGLVGSYFTFPSIARWYLFLEKPIFTPPNWIFGPVWTLLYIMMGISLFIVSRRKINKKITIALQLFFLQLFLNLLWSIVFFGGESILGGLVVIILMWGAILATTLSFAKISRNAALLLLPYLAWVTFATFLNFSILLLNW